MNYDLNNLITEMSKSSILFQKYINANPSYILKKYLKEKHTDEFDLSHIDINLQMQNELKRIINNEIEQICTYNKRIIGIKGCFLENNYYKSTDYERYYKDIDIIVSDDLVYDFYLFLINKGYKILKDKHLFYNNSFLLRIMKDNYMKLVHCIDLEKEICTNNSKHHVYIDLHSNLNVGLDTNFIMPELYESSKKVKYKNYEIYELLPLEYVSYLIIHMVKHLPYVNHYNTEISIDIQKIYDIFLLISNNNVKTEELEKYFSKIKSLHYYVFFIKIYNDIFMHKNINYLELINKCNTKWKNLLKDFVIMNISKIMLGDYEDDIPIINKAYDICCKIKDQNIRFIIWEFYMRLITKKRKGK